MATPPNMSETQANVLLAQAARLEARTWRLEDSAKVLDGYANTAGDDILKESYAKRADAKRAEIALLENQIDAIDTTVDDAGFGV